MEYDISKLKLPENYEIKEHSKDKLVVSNGETKLEINFKKSKYCNVAEYFNTFSANITKNNITFDTFDSPWKVDTSFKEIQDAINRLRYFPFGKENDLPSPESIVNKLFPRIYINGLSGTIKSYYHNPCVLSYALTEHYCYMLIKTKRTYKGLLFIGGEHLYSYSNRVEIIPVGKVIEAINKHQNYQPEIKHLDEKYKREIIAKMI